MRAGTLIGVLLLAACVGPPPNPDAATPPPPPQQAAPGVSPAEQAIRELNANPAPPILDPAVRTGQPAYNPYDVGAAGQAPVMPAQVSPAFRGL